MKWNEYFYYDETSPTGLRYAKDVVSRTGRVYKRRDDVAGFIKRLAVDEQAGNLAFSADGDECLFGIGIGRDIALGNGHAVIGQKVLDLYAIRAAGHNVQRELVISSHRSPIG